MEAIKKIGELIKNIRTDVLKLTQKELAEKLQITIVYMSYLEQGKKIPSLDFLTKLFRLSGKKQVPAEIKQLVSEAKSQKKKENYVNTPTNIVYRLEEQGLYSYTKLKNLQKKKPDDLVVIYGILTLLLRENKLNEAKKHILQSLINIEKLEERKWLEATYYEIEGNFPVSIQLMDEAIQEFEKQNPRLNEDNRKTKARLLFEIACIYFKYGQHLYYENLKKEAIANFQKSLEKHEELKKIYKEPFYQMDYAGLFFWLALLEIEPKKNWENYIRESKEALLINYYSGINSSQVRDWKPLYTKPYIISSVSFLARAYAQLAKLIKDKKEQLNLINEGEFILAQYTPVDIPPANENYYRYYFNQACYYSLKAEILSGRDENYEKELDICYKVLQEASFGDLKNKVKLFSREIKNSEGISFFRQQRKGQYQDMLQKLLKNQ